MQGPGSDPSASLTTLYLAFQHTLLWKILATGLILRKVNEGRVLPMTQQTLEGEGSKI